MLCHISKRIKCLQYKMKQVNIYVSLSKHPFLKLVSSISKKIYAKSSLNVNKSESLNII